MSDRRRQKVYEQAVVPIPLLAACTVCTVDRDKTKMVTQIFRNIMYRNAMLKSC